MKKYIFLTLVLSMGLLFSCNNKQPHPVSPDEVQIKARVNIVPTYQGTPLSFNENYTTQEGYAISFTKLNLIMTKLNYNGKQLFESRSEEHTSELQSRPHLVCRLLLE